MKEAWIDPNIKLEGNLIVHFRETRGITESLALKCYPNEHEANLAIGMFVYGDIYKKMAES